MECIYCDSSKTYTTDSRNYCGYVIRQRICKECGNTFYTKEEEFEDMSEIRKCWAASKMGYRDRRKRRAISN